MKVRIDAMTRYVTITYPVPKDAPDVVLVRCSWSPAKKNDWRQARALPLLSETALRLSEDAQRKEWIEQGQITERRAAGLERSVVFNPYPEAQSQGKIDIDFRVQALTVEGKSLWSGQTPVQADNTDVIYLEDWSRVLQTKAVVAGNTPQAGKWLWSAKLSSPSTASFGSGLSAKAGQASLKQLTYPLSLKGWYALYVHTAPGIGIRLRLTGDERSETLSSSFPYEEVLWAWKRLDRQHLVIRQPHTYTGYTDAQLDYMKLVPLSEAQVKRLEAPFRSKRDKRIIGYFEPDSWAFVEDLQETLQHREPIAAFAEAGVDIVNSSIGRAGMKAMYESRATDQLLEDYLGDPDPTNPAPTTDTVGQMQQYTNTLDAELRYARELGMPLFASFGAANAYPGTSLQGDITKKNPHWLRDSFVRYELPEVRAYVMSLYREALEIGASGIAIDYCRYPEGMDSRATCTAFMRDLRKLTEEFRKQRGKPVPILVRFPAKGVRLAEYFDYATWAREGLVDYLCPSNIQARHLHFDIADYQKAVKGTACKLLPCVDGLQWALEMPGLFLWRVQQLYDQGVEGIYVYQADARIIGRIEDRRYFRLIGSSAAVRDWWKQDAALRPQCSKGIYRNRPASPNTFYSEYDRLRIWVEGVPLGEVEMYLDGKLVSRYEKPPYALGTEEVASDRVVPPGAHTLRVRAKDGDGWLEQTFTIHGSPNP